VGGGLSDLGSRDSRSLLGNENGSVGGGRRLGKLLRPVGGRGSGGTDGDGGGRTGEGGGRGRRPQEIRRGALSLGGHLRVASVGVGVPTLVLLPSPGAYRALFRPLARAIARRGIRVLLMDLPGGGVLSSVPWSLRACEQAVHAVADREACLAGGRVVLAAWGAAAFCAASSVLRDARRFAGLICFSTVPDYVGIGPFAGTDGVLRLDWAQWLENERCRAEVWAAATAAGGLLSEGDRADIVGVDFNPTTVPVMLEEVCAKVMMMDMRFAPRISQRPHPRPRCSPPPLATLCVRSCIEGPLSRTCER
jgi:pimeloyl-ACP methyl ester carboxylesterase